MKYTLQSSVLAVLVLFLLCPVADGQSVIYVDADAVGAGNGTSWNDAFPDVQTALGIAGPNDDLWVAEGVYFPTVGGDREATFQLLNGVALYGGFDGTETTLSERDWVSNETILSGDLGTPGVATDNSYHVVTGSGTDQTAQVDGFTVTAAYANGVFPRNRGGGMRNIAGSPTVRHCVFRENTSLRSPDSRDGFGAGMFNENGSNPLIEDVRFEHNYTSGAGAGLSNRVNSSPTLRRVVFLENVADLQSGGMGNESNSSPLMVDVQFIRNVSNGWSGGLDNYDGSSPTLINVVFLGNVCANYGGGMTNDTNANATLTNVLFVGNVAHNLAATNGVGAGGLQNNGSSPTLVGVTFVENEAPDGADGFGHRDSGTSTLRDVIFWGNGDELVDEAGGGIDISHAVVEGGFAGGTAILDANPEFVTLPTPGPDGEWGTMDDDFGDLHLRVGSPALDAGDASHLPADFGDLDGDSDTSEPIPFDLDGNTRVVAADLDLGAFEGGVVVSNESAPDNGSAPHLGSLTPNPSDGPVTIPFTISSAEHIRLSVLDMRGRTIHRLLDEPRSAGSHEVYWTPGGLARGTYLIVLETTRGRRVRLLVWV